MASSSSTAPTTLGNPPSDKLTRANFPGWRDQVLPTIRGAHLLGYLTGTAAAPPEELEHQIVLSYLLPSLSHEVLPNVHRIEHAAGVWKALEEMFTSQSEAKITNLRTSLANTKKVNMSTVTYLTKMQGFIAELAMAGCPVSTREHVSFILAGLGGSYNSLVATLGRTLRPLPMPRNANAVAAQIKAETVVTAVTAVIAVTAVTVVTIGTQISVMIVLPPMAMVVVAHRLVLAGAMVAGVAT
ncbi:hypothetical protein QYE76_056010 [Lolium multiflorum]|uniref:Uncharacterized protein n=1 Tax=Lolium multiflorum TaxID=4521 RepID=A0AAD8T243_LOLMU|nr:hypothetical protein QYE76_056010 [Lolium multiflorum]